MTSSARHIPGEQFKIRDRKELFAAINEMVTKAGDGWLTSVPGAAEMALETLPMSVLPSELAALGYCLEPLADGQRMLPMPILERVKLEGSSVPITVTHAGVVVVRRFSFPID
ncbi:hypothetical protein IVA88_20730 [Bradyrhizobium sp. 149]|uniref:hypothetical protein n=1 Tax=Bradyrhizobium sp. 149 TaxID=2782624 RepID=UPI001FFB5F33|nr:hypothetical protein [Bradyrhizobium sp. 149]MCK1653847.1 hypothetical protein [Bradyrhizobium sp. 149]